MLSSLIRLPMIVSSLVSLNLASISPPLPSSKSSRSSAQLPELSSENASRTEALKLLKLTANRPFSLLLSKLLKRLQLLQRPRMPAPRRKKPPRRNEHLWSTYHINVKKINMTSHPSRPITHHDAYHHPTTKHIIFTYTFIEDLQKKIRRPPLLQFLHQRRSFLGRFDTVP